MLNAEAIIVGALAALIGSFFGSYLSGYLEKKGENLATHEDLDNLVEQMKAVTKATKEIESKISGELWDRQKWWELKRDILFEATKNIAAIKITLPNLSLAYKMQIDANHPADELSKFVLEANEKFAEALRNYDLSVMMMALVCGNELNQAAFALATLARATAVAVSEGNTDAYYGNVGGFMSKIMAAGEGIKKELKGNAEDNIRPSAGVE